MLEAQLIKWTLRVLGAALIIAALWFVHHSIKQSGFREGAASVQDLWNAETAQYNEEIAKLKEDAAAKEAAHRTENTRITHELSEANKRHAVELAALQSASAERLRLSTQRSAIYQHQAESGAAQCRDLASHASRLDAALEEGRILEQEYRSTLGLRDEQLKALSNQIRNDRNLMDN